MPLQSSIKTTTFTVRGAGKSAYNPAWGRNLGNTGGQFGAPELNELKKIRFNLVAFLDLEKEQTKYLGDRILKFARSEEKKKGEKEESQQESKKGGLGNFLKSASKNPIAKKALAGLSGIGDFLSNIVKVFITYKILEWVGNPENTKKVVRIVKGIAGIIGFLGKAVKVLGFIVENNPITWAAKLTIEGVKTTFGIIGNIIKFFGWIGDTLGDVGDNIGNLFSVFNLIPQAIDNFIGFFTEGIPKFLENVLTEGLFGSQKELEGELQSSESANKSEDTSSKSGSSSKVDFGKLIGDKAKDAIGNIGKTLLGMLFPGANIALDIGSKVFSGIKGLFGGNKEENIPKLAKGGIVTKPTQAIVGEAGPEAILPLEKLDSFMGVAKSVSSVVPKFMKLLTLPFTIIGAGIVALISTSLSSIPGIGPLIAPLVASVAGAFGLPPSLVAGLSKFGGKSLQAIAGGLGGVAELFGLKEPNITARPGGKYNPTKDKSMRGLLGNILNILITKLKPSSGNDKTPPAAPAATPGAAGAPPTGALPGAGGAPVSASDFGKTQLESTKPVFGTGRRANVLQDVGNKNLQRVTGENPGKYFYDAYGNVYAVDKDEKRILTPADFKAGVGGRAGALYFFRNLNNGTVSISRHADATSEGWYDYAANAVREMQSGSRAGVIWVPAAESKKYKSGFSEGTPYGKTTLKARNGTYIPGNLNGDRVPALLEQGEYVFNKRAVKEMGGPKVLDSLNYGAFPRFAQWGGHVLKMATGGTVIEYITGDKSHPSYASDHGGGNYHDHLAFKSKAERDAAIKHLESKGWYIGSKNDGRHASGSYHYSDQAFDIPFYPNQSRKGVSDNQSGETRLSSMLRADLASGGFSVPGGPSAAGTRPEDDANRTAPSQEEKVDWTGIAKSLGNLFKDFQGGPAPSESVAQAPPPKITPTPSASSSALQRSQSENNKLQAQSRTGGRTAGGNVVTLGNPNQVIQSTSTQPMSPSLGGTSAPTPLTIYPVAP